MTVANLPLLNLQLLALLVVFNLADAWSTYYAIKRGAYERWGWMCKLMQIAGVKGALAAGKIAVIFIAFAWLRHDVAGLFVLVLVFAGLTANNLWVIWKMRKGRP